jgi:3',5'-nucleoside bisphosphate phosphatase
VPDAPIGFVDLHTHSTASDGSRSPTALVEEARRLGLAAVALTDHDTLDGIAEAQAAAQRLGIRLVVGIELSAVEQDEETHVLGLHLAECDELQHRLIELKQMRRTRAERIVARLNELGVRIGFDDVLECAAGGALGRPHVARALVNGGWAMDFRDAFGRYLGNGRPAYVGKDRLPIAEAFEMIHRAKGLAVLAHPGSAGKRDRVEALKMLGLDGLEVVHPSHNAEDVARLGVLADHFALVRSGGSDWHGAAEGGRVLGTLKVPGDWLCRQDEVIAQRASRERVA